MSKIKRVKIFDMDGTIVSSLHRYQTIIHKGVIRIDLQHWRNNENKADKDTLLPLAQYYKKCLNNPNVYVIIATARVIGAKDAAFITEILGKPDYMISRARGDTRGGAYLKVMGLQKFFNLKPFKNASFTFYEDNAAYLKEVCDLYNIRGVYIPSQQGH